MRLPSIGESETLLRKPPDQTLQRRRDFPTWHFSMLNDDMRNEAILRSIRAAEPEGKVVVEIGTGSGVIAVLFARCGAAHVWTCEMNPTLANVAGQIIRHHGEEDRITVIPLRSDEAIKSGLLPSSPDIIFTETVDCGIVGEGFHSISADIRRLAGQQTQVLPRMIRQWGVLASSEAIFRRNHVKTALDLDLSILNRFSTRSYFPIWSRLYPWEALNEPLVVRSYDYLRSTAASSVTIAIERSGTAHGILTWLEIDFGHGVVTSHPEVPSHWHQAFHPFQEPLELHFGRSVKVKIADDGTASICP